MRHGGGTPILSVLSGEGAADPDPTQGKGQERLEFPKGRMASIAGRINNEISEWFGLEGNCLCWKGA